ncbi:MAG TPA: hypothetical protein DCQ31_08115, partial [Bacteroidales bacterium]|nr:hypothetical protein [Bacteroidales bacterium]
MQIMYVFAQDSQITLNTTLSGQLTYEKRDSITLAPGFYYSSTNGYSFTAKLNEELITNTVYIPSINAVSRVLDKTLPVGTLAGSHNVTPAGGLTYQIPIFTSPGTAGVQPQVSIVYNSQGGNGTLGMGWEIAGMSAITRVPTSQYNLESETDVVRGVKLTNEDRFALDGNRLYVDSLTYGANKAKYKTEVESFSNVQSFNVAGDGPEYFIVTTKDGQILEYGKTEDARIQPHDHATPYMWRLNKVTDVHGNYIIYKYNEIEGESWLTEIQYTGNTTTGLQPYNKIRFLYQTKTDANVVWIAGKEVHQKKLLRAIKVEADGELVKEYKFNYSFDFYTHLNEIIETDAKGIKLNATIINNGGANANFAAALIPQNTSGAIIYTGDFNGDGRTDLYTIPKTYQVGYNDNLYLMQENGTIYHAAYYPSTPDWSRQSKNQGIDFNNDGKLDLLYCAENQYQTGKFEYQYRIKLSGNFQNSYDISLNYGDRNEKDTTYFVGDFNGDGRIDLLFPNFIGTGWKMYYYNNGLQVITGATIAFREKVDVLDFDGDGISEVMTRQQNFGSILKLVNNNFQIIYENVFPSGGQEVFNGDFNGDGKDDILTYSNSLWSVHFSTGSGYSWTGINLAIRNLNPNNSPYLKIITDDFNGDGKADIAEITADYNVLGQFTGNTINIWYYNGTNFIKETKNDYSTGLYTINQIAPCDFNADGKTDLFLMEKGLIYYIHQNEQKHLVTSITDGLNRRTEIKYNTLSQGGSTFYTKQTGAVFPATDFQGALTAVENIKVQIKPGIFNTTTYAYAGAKIHRQGRGFLGFSKTEVVNSATGAKSINYFENIAPYYIPTLVKTETYVGTTLVSSQTSVNKIRTISTKRYLPYVESSIATDHLKNIVVKKYFAYDNYGNLTNDSTIFSNDGYLVVKSNYISKGGIGIPNRPEVVNTKKLYTGQTGFTNAVKYEYNNNGTLSKEMLNYGKGIAFEVTNSFSYNAYGLVYRTELSTHSSNNLPKRVQNTLFETKYRFITELKDTLFRVQKQFEPQFGNLVKEIGADLKSTASYTYNSFGQLTGSTAPDLQKVNTITGWESIVPGAVYFSQTSSVGKPWVKHFYNQLGQEVQTQTQALNGIVFSDKEYNTLGQLVKQSLPYFENETKRYLTYTYDEFGRIKTEKNHDLTATTYTYTGNTVSTLTPDGKQFSKTYDAWGNIKTATDAGGTVVYKYNSTGQPYEIDANGSLTKISYNIIGKQDTLNDPNAGTTTYKYNSFGELTEQTDARGKVTELKYDHTGRIVKKISPDQTIDYSYKPSGNGTGKISSELSDKGYAKSYVYDIFGRDSIITETINGQQFSFAYTYDQYGNLSKVMHHGGFELYYSYNSYGYLNSIIDNQKGKTLWTAKTENAA